VFVRLSQLVSEVLMSMTCVCARRPSG